jgi:Zn-dependent M28 family amino/carboxypeptidase
MDEETDASEIFQIAAALEGGAAGQLPIPVIGLRHDVGEDFLRAAGVPVGASPGPPSILLETNISIQSEFVQSSDDVPNVVGMIRGSHPELAESYVVLTAHYDHVGVGPPDEFGDSIYSGADDNASGTSALMQIAAAFAELPRAPPRSVIFLAVSGEEKGLLGSAHYAASPTVPGAAIIGSLNMDMVGRNHPDTLFAIGEEYTTIGATAYRVVTDRPELGLVLAPDPEPEEQAFLRSDHFSFVQQGIPALMLTTWLHDDYHLPSDTIERIDADKVARVARLIFYLTYDLAADPLEPDWTDQGRTLLENLPMF